eukprot:CAMPEP_0172485016 /NCGR_PEP_ID=MMETSP1066-20121228/12738_1 /TAXON_ID=671091 /ORGANISM="Coscinodiscus wailesii, Strain CCMP2513" /LENGTH=742 /DNA_ID=CAMNT_0013249905 /DNA_START=320 /DNA_END=2544 /DNA_ORIENTATION=+
MSTTSHPPSSRRQSSDDDGDSSTSSISSNSPRNLPKSELRRQIKCLRDRLDRRNVILDAIRGAYHRDVLLVKQKILKARKDAAEDYDDDDDDEAWDPKITEILGRLPSLDIRPALMLFAPTECELKVKPCSKCGGTLEIIHRESTRIRKLQESYERLQAVEQETRLRASRSEIITQKTQKDLCDLRDRSLEDRRIFVDEITSLKFRLKEHEIMMDELRRTKEYVKELETERAEDKKKLVDLAKTKEELAALKIRAEEMRQQIEENEAEIKNLKHCIVLAEEREKSLRGEIKKLNNEVASLKTAISLLEDNIRSLNKDIERREEEKQRMKQVIESLENKQTHLENIITKLKKDHRTAMQRSKREYDKLAKASEDLRTELRTKESEWEAEKATLRDKIKELKRRKDDADAFLLAAQQAAQKESEEDEIDRMQRSLNKLFKQLRLYASNVYDHCVMQENALSEHRGQVVGGEGGGEDLIPEDAVIGEMPRTLMNHFVRRDDGKSIDWARLLRDDGDREAVLKYLDERRKVGLRELKKIMRVVIRQHRETVTQLEHESSQKIDNLKCHYEERIAGLELVNGELKDIKEKREESIRVLTKQYNDTKKALERLKMDFFNAQQDIRRKLEEITLLEKKLKDHVDMIRDLSDDLQKSRAHNKSLEQMIAENDTRIFHQLRDIATLESSLRRSDARYRTLVDDEKQRLATNVHVATQFAPDTRNASCHADFLPVTGTMMNNNNTRHGKEGG